MKAETNQSQINVLIITSSYPMVPGDFQGTFVEKQVKSLQEKGFNMIVLSPYVPGSKFFEKSENLKIYRFPYFYPLSLHRLCSSGGMYFGFMNSFLGKIQVIPYLFSMIMFAGILIKREKISLIHTHWVLPQGIAGVIWEKISGLPHISTAHVLDITITEKNHILNGLLKWILINTDIITVNSAYTREQVLKNSGSRLSSIFIIPMGMDDSRISGYNPTISPNRREYQILFVGRIIDWKGIDTLIESMGLVKRIIPEVTLKIIGEGPDRCKYMEKVQSLGLDKQIHFLGKVSDFTLNGEYASSNLFVLPSRPHKGIVMEGLGVVLLEAMASGVPVIGSNTGGIPDIIQDGINGFLVPPGDPDALADAIIRILTDPALAERFRQAGMQTVRERFSWDIISRQFMKVYQEALKDSVS